MNPNVCGLGSGTPASTARTSNLYLPGFSLYLAGDSQLLNRGCFFFGRSEHSKLTPEVVDEKLNLAFALPLLPFFLSFAFSFFFGLLSISVTGSVFGGGGAAGGRITVFSSGSGVGSETFGSAGTAGSAGSGTTGGASGGGNTNQVSL